MKLLLILLVSLNIYANNCKTYKTKGFQNLTKASNVADSRVSLAWTDQAQAYFKVYEICIGKKTETITVICKYPNQIGIPKIESTDPYGSGY